MIAVAFGIHPLPRFCGQQKVISAGIRNGVLLFWGRPRPFLCYLPAPIGRQMHRVRKPALAIITMEPREHNIKGRIYIDSIGEKFQKRKFLIRR